MMTIGIGICGIKYLNVNLFTPKIIFVLSTNTNKRIGEISMNPTTIKIKNNIR